MVETGSYTMAELMVAAAAREIKDNEIVFVGMRLPLLSYLLAKESHAPGAVSVFENGVIRDAPARDPIFTISDPPNLLGALKCTDMVTVMSYLQRGAVDVGFIGAAEVDRFGNLNSSYIAAGEGHTIRLPGSGGACDIACLAKRLLIIIAHEVRRLVQKVNYITSPGFGAGPGWRESQGLGGTGPSAIITTKGVLKFDPESKEAYLHSYHPGISVEEIVKDTGWKLMVSSEVKMTEPPSQAELAIIKKYDPHGFWTG